LVTLLSSLSENTTLTPASGSVPGLVAGLPPKLTNDLRVLNGLLGGERVDEDVLREVLSPSFLALAAVAGLALVLCCCLIVAVCARLFWCCCCRKKKTKRDKEGYQPPSSQKVRKIWPNMYCII